MQVSARSSMTERHLPSALTSINPSSPIWCGGEFCEFFSEKAYNSSKLSTRAEDDGVFSLLTAETEAGTSKCRWRVGNMGAEWDEGITSPEIKELASHTQSRTHSHTHAHTKNKSSVSPPRLKYLSPVLRQLSKGHVLSLIFVVSAECLLV